MDRVNFLESVSGIQYPEVMVVFFDHFIALKQIVEDSGTVNVLKSDEKDILFSIRFNSKQSRDLALNIVNSLNGNIIVYGRSILINVEILTDTEIKINLC